jgi:hypothetical protein
MTPRTDEYRAAVAEARANIESQFHAGGFDVDGLDAYADAVRTPSTEATEHE